MWSRSKIPSWSGRKFESSVGAHAFLGMESGHEVARPGPGSGTQGGQLVRGAGRVSTEDVTFDECGTETDTSPRPTGKNP